MLTRTSLLIALLLAATPASAVPVDRGMQGGAHHAGCSACSNDTQSGGGRVEHPNAIGQSFSSPPSFPWSAGASANHGVGASVGGGSWSPQAQTGTEPGID